MVFVHRKGPRMLQRYRCQRCGEETDYIVRLPEPVTHYRKAGGNGQRCGGREVFIGERTEGTESPPP